MDLSIFFQPIDSFSICKSGSFPPGTIGDSINTYSSESVFPELAEIDIVLIGVCEDRNAVGNKGCAAAPNEVRKRLYQLYKGDHDFRVADLGNIQAGHSIEDTYYALTSCLTELLRKKVVAVIIGGGQDLTYPNYCAYQNLEQIINIVSVDSSFDIGEMDAPLDSRSYLSKIILHQPNYLFNFSNIGYQTYFVDGKSIELIEKLYFDTYRLGQVRSNIEEVEPIVRNADILSFDLSSIKQADAPANSNASPNGFYGEEACRIVRYAGMSDKLSSIGFYELNPLLDRDHQSAHLVAQMIWYFINGYYGRKQDYPVGDKSGYLKYRVNIKGGKYEIVFYKSNKSDRWWMEVPYPNSQKSKYERHTLIPCSYDDYKTACNEEMPDRWWQAYQKLC